MSNMIEGIIDSLKDTYSEEDAVLNKSIALNIYEQVDNYAKDIKPSDEEIAMLVLAMNENVQIRDFVLGLPSERELVQVHTWLSYIGDNTPFKYLAPIATIKSAFSYESGDRGGADYYLKKALEINPQYSLAHLLNRTYQAYAALNIEPIEPGMFADMRDTLHPKVKEILGVSE